MQTDKIDMKVEKSVSMHSHAFERQCKRDWSQIVQHITNELFENKQNMTSDQKISKITSIHD